MIRLYIKYFYYMSLLKLRNLYCILIRRKDKVIDSEDIEVINFLSTHTGIMDKLTADVESGKMTKAEAIEYIKDTYIRRRKNA